MRAWVAEQERVSRSAAFSVAVHGGLLGAYLLYRALNPAESGLIITDVDFVDLAAPAAPAAPPPAMAAPRGVADFLRMALPTLRPSGPREAPRELEAPREPRLESATPALVDRGGLRRGPAIDVSARAPARSGPALGELAAAGAERRAAEIAAPAAGPAIELEAVGRRGARAPAPAIRLESGGAGPRLQDLPLAAAAAPRAGASAPSQVREAGIRLEGGGAPARRPGGALPVGYARGGGLSLAERPSARRGGGLAAPAPPPPSPGAKAPAEAAPSRKGGIEISGPLAGRGLLSARMPAYPDWAQERGVEADVLIRFFVGPDGRVLERMIVERTSGHKELDARCLEALARMLFAPLPAGRTEDQWGIVTFRFRLK